MSQKNVIYLVLLLSLTCPALPAFGQDKPDNATKAPKAAPEKDKDAAEDAPVKKSEGDTPAESDDAVADAEAGSDDETTSDEEVDEDEDGDNFEEDEELNEETDEGDGEEGAMTLAPPKTIELDMEALGEINPEKELAEGGELDQKTDTGKEETWTERALDILELHGYYRLRPELYHKFNIRNDSAIFNQTVDQRYGRKNPTSTGANMRFRLEPTLNISEEIRIKSQIDLLDNVMLGSTPRYWQGFGYSESEAQGSTINPGRVQGWDMGPPSSDDMIVVRRVWGEVMTPLGQLRFGRMGDHFGTGMLHHAGNELFSDFGNTVDRIMFAAKINDWLIAPAFDFPNEGMVGNNASGRPFDVSQLDDAYRLVGIFAYMHDKETQAAMLRRGDWLVNAGLYFSYQWQVLSFENGKSSSGEYDSDFDNSFSTTDEIWAEKEDVLEEQGGYYDHYKREMWTITPNLWFQLLYDTFHLELEAALIYGKVGNVDSTENATDELTPLTLLQWGGVLQMDYGLLSDALRIGAEFGYAQGDKDVEGIRAPGTYYQENNNSDDTYTAFSFNPAYNMDLILHRHILGSVSQSFYLKGWLQYDILKNPMGRKLGLRADVIYSRAVFAESTINNDAANLGVELNAQVRYESADGFYAGVAYGVLFPLSAFKGDPTENDEDDDYILDNNLSIPQTLQTVLGITF